MVRKLTEEELKRRVFEKSKGLVELIECGLNTSSYCIFLDNECKTLPGGGYFKMRMNNFLNKKCDSRHPEIVKQRFSKRLKDPNIRQKIKDTNTKKYGGPSPFHNSKIQQKVKDKVKEIYQVNNISQLNFIKQQKIDTCQRNFGVNNPSQSDIIMDRKMETFIKIGKKHPSEDSKTLDELRNGRDGRRWQRLVKKRDNNTCQKCKTNEDIKAHHIYSFSLFPKLRFDIDNGICLCKPCHDEFHRKYEIMPKSHYNLVEYLGLSKPEWDKLKRIAEQNND